MTDRMNIRKISYTSFFIALGIIVPQLFHLIGGLATGMTLLPMHIPVLLGAILLGPGAGMTVGTASVLIGFLLGMPAMPMAIFMFFELSVYGLVAGYLGQKKLNVYIVLLISMLSGRFVSWTLMRFVMGILSIELPKIFGTMTIYISGLPGIFVQLIVIPPLVYVLRRFVNYE